MPSEIRSIGPTIRRLAKGTIDLVRWRAPVQLLKYATRTVWFKNVNTGYPVEKVIDRVESVSEESGNEFSWSCVWLFGVLLKTEHMGKPWNN